MSIRKIEDPLLKILSLKEDLENVQKDPYDLDVKLSAADMGDHPVDCTSETCNCKTKACNTYSNCATCSCQCPSRFCCGNTYSCR
jgi:hypothetical protein